MTKIKLLTFIRYFAESLFFPFISLYLSSLGYTTSQIGIFIAIIPITSIIMNPIYSIFCKNPTITKRVLMVMSLIEGLLVMLLLKIEVFSGAIVIMILISIVSSSNYGLIDSLIALTCEENACNFSTVRVFGSASYMIGAFFAGYIAKYTSYEVLFIIAASLFLVVSIMYLFVKTPKKADGKVVAPIGYKELFKNKQFIGYLLFYILLIGTMQVGDDFFSIYLKSKGSPDYVYSYVMLGFLLIEVITMTVLNHIKMKSFLWLYFISASCLVVRLLIQSIPQASVGVLIASQCLRGIIWGIALFVSSRYVVKILGFDSATKGIMLITLCLSVFTSIFKAVGGKLIDMIGYPSFYLILLIISILALVYFCYIYHREKTAKKNESIHEMN